jgi:hypothetical protein
MRKLILLLTTLLLTACGPEAFTAEEEGITFRCDNTDDNFDGVTYARIDLDCVDCDVQNEHAVNDSYIRTAAAITIPITSPETQGAGIFIGHSFFRGFYDAGNEAGAFIRFPENTGGTLASYAVRIRTFDTSVAGQEIVQEVAQTGADITLGEKDLARDEIPVSDPALPNTWVHFTTSKPFDAVEIHISATGLHDGPVTTQVHALCRNSSVSY